MLSVVQTLQQPCDRGELRPTTPQVSEGRDEEAVHDHRAGSQGPRAHVLISTSSGSHALSLGYAVPGCEPSHGCGGTGEQWPENRPAQIRVRAKRAFIYRKL